MVIRKSVTTGVYLYPMFSCLDMKRTTDSKTESKLDTGLEPTGPKKTMELKFTDYSINKFQGHNTLYLFQKDIILRSSLVIPPGGQPYILVA